MAVQSGCLGQLVINEVEVSRDSQLASSSLLLQPVSQPPEEERWQELRFPAEYSKVCYQLC